MPQRLTDDFFLTGGCVTHSHIATWTLIVVLDAPQPEVTLRVKVQQLRSYILSVLSDHRVPNITKGSWLQRLQAIESQIPHSTPIGRRTQRAFLTPVASFSRRCLASPRRPRWRRPGVGFSRCVRTTSV